ncbi:MAG TPA: tetratricopeptide repeat protein [Sphingomicrobium sp.]|nr:tetratricopeptide repeat protein [Sphingomicrobium sp.]
MPATRPALAASFLILAATSAPAVANSSGGSMGSMPSVSAPEFDIAEEYRRGIDALKASQFADAKKAFDKVLGVAPTDANANFLAGMARAGLNDFKGAAKNYERAVKADSKLVAAHQELAVTYLKLGRRDKAEAQLAKLQKLEASCAGTCKDAQAIKDAVTAVQAALAAPPQASLTTMPPLLFASSEAGDHAYLDAVALINDHRYPEAIQSLERARAAFGAHPDILTYLGFANRKLHRFDAAEHYYRMALAAEPEHRQATEYYGELMVERGDLAGAKAMLARLEGLCTFGCAEADELRQWIAAKGQPAS